jgi:hypothetical protein
MNMLKELLGIITEGTKKKKKKGVPKSAAASVYHRDYEKTKHKAYREYDADERKIQREGRELVCVYFDHTGAGRGPEPVAGPFSRAEADKWLLDNDVDPNDKQYFIDSAKHAR